MLLHGPYSYAAAPWCKCRDVVLCFAILSNSEVSTGPVEIDGDCQNQGSEIDK